MAGTYPQSSTVGEQINKFRTIGREWPVEFSEKKDKSKTYRNLTAAPIRRFRLEYQAIAKSFFNTLVAHYDSCKGSAEVFQFSHPYDATIINCRYVAFDFPEIEKAPNPNEYPWVTVELEEVL